MVKQVILGVVAFFVVLIAGILISTYPNAWYSQCIIWLAIIGGAIWFIWAAAASGRRHRRIMENLEHLDEFFRRDDD